MIRGFFQSFKAESQPLMTRQAYAYERWSALYVPCSIGLIEAAVVGVLAKKTFDVSDLNFSVIMAAPFFANVTSFVWARLARGRRKIPLITVMFALMLICVGAIAALPISETGGQLLTILIVISRCLIAGIITVRSSVWRNNYPREVRARITGKLVMISTLTLTIVPQLGYSLFDKNPEAFRYVYPLAAVIAGIGVIYFSRIRLRGEKALLAYENQPSSTAQPHGSPAAPIYEYDPNSPKPTFWSVLKKDVLYRKYMLLQFLMGTANIAAMTVVIYIVAEMTEEMSNGYKISIAVTSTIPTAICMLTLSKWAKYLDRVNIARFRVFHSASFAISHSMNMIGAMTGLLPLIAVGQFLHGGARGGAMLAWSLGHNDFASRQLVAIYMGIHVTLTGIRGAFAPFLAVALYTGWDAQTIGWLDDLQIPAYAGIGNYVFPVCIVCFLISSYGFHTLDKQMRAVPQQD